jgi:hypothetical protein
VSFFRKISPPKIFPTFFSLVVIITPLLYVPPSLVLSSSPTTMMMLLFLLLALLTPTHSLRYKFYDILLHESASFGTIVDFLNIKNFFSLFFLPSKNSVRCVWVRKYENRLWSSWILRFGWEIA